MIERLYVHNYRCLENFTLDFQRQRSAVLIGKNGAGKSTVLDALRVFQSICRGPNRVRDVIRAKDFAQNEKNRPMRFEVDLSLGERKFRYAVAFEWPSDFHEARIGMEELSSDGVAVFTRHQGQVQLTGGAQFGLDWHVFALPVVNENPTERSIQDVRAFFANMILVAPIPQLMTGLSDEPRTDLDRQALNYASCLRAIFQTRPKSYGVFESFVKDVLPDFSSLENDPRGKEGGSQQIVTFETTNPLGTLQLDFDELSDGEKCFFLSAYVIAASAVRTKTDPPVICVWDEPDHHLSLSEVGHFITALRRMTNLGGQFIATTHHPETIRKFSEDNTFVLTRNSHVEPTIVKLLNTYSYNGDLIHALIRDEIIG